MTKGETGGGCHQTGVDKNMIAEGGGSEGMLPRSKADDKTMTVEEFMQMSFPNAHEEIVQKVKENFEPEQTLEPVKVYVEKKRNGRINIGMVMTHSSEQVKSICIRPGCKNPAKARGLCNSCANHARQLINQKVTTWEELEASGCCLPKALQVAEATQWFLEKLGKN